MYAAHSKPLAVAAPKPSGYQLRFRSMFYCGHGFAFPCDASGNVNLDSLGERARRNFLRARASVGREFLFPVVEAVLAEPMAAATTDRAGQEPTRHGSPWPRQDASPSRTAEIGRFVNRGTDAIINFASHEPVSQREPTGYP